MGINWICSPGPSGELTPREHPCPASQVPPSADTAGQTTSEVCNLFVWSPRTCQRGINEVLLLLEDWWGRGDGALWIAISVASRKIYFLKKTCDSPRAKGIEPFKQIQIHLKSVQTRKHSQGLWEDGYGQGGDDAQNSMNYLDGAAGPQKDLWVSLHKGFDSTWNRNVHPKSIKIPIRFLTHSGPLKTSQSLDYIHRNALLLSELYLKYYTPKQDSSHATEKPVSFPLLLGGVLPKERNWISPCITVTGLQSHFGMRLLSRLPLPAEL